MGRLELYLIRHGESEGNRDGIYQGQTDYPLTDLGREQSRLLARHLAESGVVPDAIFTSPLSRAVQTAAIVREILGSRDPVVSELLSEIAVGPLAGLSAWDAAELWPEEMERFHRGTSLGELFPGAETWAQVQDRAARALGMIVDALPAGTALVTSHAAFLVNFHKALLQVPPSRKLIFKIPNTGFSRVILEGDLIWLTDLAVAPHLGPGGALS